MKLVILAFSLVLSLPLWSQTKATQKLFRAIEKNDLDLAEAAIKAGADVNGVDNISIPTTTALLHAVKFNRLDIVKLLLDNHADVNQHRPIDLFTGLIIAAKFDFADIAKLLLANGADVNATSIFLRSALDVAALHNSVNTAKLLVENKTIDVNARGSHCALAVASRQGNIGIVLLLKKLTGAQAPSPACLNKAIQLAEFNHHDDVLSVLKRN